jgi:Flp pilus assembly protein TadG
LLVTSSVKAKRLGSQALVEFTLVVSVFFLLVLGTFDVARAYLAYTVVTNAVRETARYAAAHQADSNWQTASVQAGLNLTVGVDPNALQLSTPTQQTIDQLTYISATGSYSFHSVTPLVGSLLGSTITMQVATSVLAG